MNCPIQIILVAFGLSLSSASFAADQQIGGFDGFAMFSLGHGSAKEDIGGSFNDGGLSKQLQGSLAYTHTSGWGAQVDYLKFQQNWKANIDYPSAGSRDFAEHLYYRDHDLLVGGFAQQRQYYISDDAITLKAQFTGLEGQYYFDNMTLYGQVGRSKWTGQYWLAGMSSNGLKTLELRYFVNDNFKITGAINYLKGSVGSSDTWGQTAHAVDVEYRFQNSPISLLTRYEYEKEAFNHPYSAHHQRLMFGLKLALGKDSLRQSDRNGASLKPVAKDLMWSD